MNGLMVMLIYITTAYAGGSIELYIPVVNITDTRIECQEKQLCKLFDNKENVLILIA